MLNSEMLNVFDDKREILKPYGITCELWKPNLMDRPDRHNEIELNYLSEGSLTYLYQDKKITIPAKKLTIFWGLVNHQIVEFEGANPYFVCTIPFSHFLEWKLPTSFVDRVLRGEILLEPSDDYSVYDEFLFKNWINDMKQKGSIEVTLLEIRARLLRMASRNLSDKKNYEPPIHSSEINQLEKIAIYIAQNYCNPIKVSDIGKAVGLHPDYANSIFRKAFGSTLSEYIIKERISHAQRKLVATNESITEIAFESGFNTISRFNAAFKKINSCTPRNFRKKHQ